MPQNEFCGYENPAFQAENILKNDVSLSFDNKANLCLKGNNLHNRRSRPADKDVPTIAA